MARPTRSEAAAAAVAAAVPAAAAGALQPIVELGDEVESFSYAAEGHVAAKFARLSTPICCAFTATPAFFLQVVDQKDILHSLLEDVALLHGVLHACVFVAACLALAPYSHAGSSPGMLAGALAACCLLLAAAACCGCCGFDLAAPSLLVSL
jgi:hypothetical protein